MKKLFLSFVFMFFVVFASASDCKENKIAKTVSQKILSGCSCSTSFDYGGYTFTYSVAFYTSNGSCDPCYAIDSYGAIQGPGGSILAEGVPSGYGFGFACGANMDCITKIERKGNTNSQNQI